MSMTFEQLLESVIEIDAQLLVYKLYFGNDEYRVIAEIQNKKGMCIALQTGYSATIAVNKLIEKVESLQVEKNESP